MSGTKMSAAEKAAAYDKHVAQRTKYHARRQARINVLVRKAEAAKITVTDAEVDAELKRLEGARKA